VNKFELFFADEATPPFENLIEQVFETGSKSALHFLPLSICGNFTSPYI